ncbi:FBXO18 [Lepeophtheirus salmonis]|uniref:FBXO18 n=1 Tax=Lepeophtheirus salmonis TaxID=72036 RepID=A0A7R8D222_LEPSM|nr:FBXO18 [Lepeophtheirus salmonis]CAF2997115.1 FBXO18 [Lepeophtheirus salmonis]
MIHQKNTSVPITHDGYLKLWQLRQPNLQTIVSHDVLLIDEAQDINPTMLDIINHQSTAKVIVGDPNQQIYSFRGAVNLLKEFKSSKKFSLTQSFRFGPEIAFVANCCLEHLKKNDERTLVGGRNRDMLVGSDKDVVGPVTIIGRTNGGVFQEIVRRICESDDEVKGCIIGGDKLLVEYKNLLYLREEKFNRMTKYKRFRSISSLEIFANQSNDHQLKSLISLVNCYDLPNFRRILEKIKKRCFHNEANADFVFYNCSSVQRPRMGFCIYFG